MKNTLILAAILCAFSAQAQTVIRENRPTEILGTVKAVYPVRSIQQVYGGESCTQTPVQTETRRHSHGNIPGAIVGGAIGSQIGKGTGRDVAIVIGSIYGWEAGREQSQSSTTMVTRCTPIYYNQTVITGYRVTLGTTSGVDHYITTQFEPIVGEQLRVIY